MKDAERWPFIAPHCRRMASFAYYITDQYNDARAVDAPRDTYALGGQGERIFRVSELDEYGIARHERDAGVTLASVLEQPA